jgi:hypothetical protein
MRGSLLAFSLLALASSPCSAQEDYEVRCEVYRFDASARAKLFAEGVDATAERARAFGRLRFEAKLPCKGQQLAKLSTSRKYPFKTQTTNNVATSSSVSFMTIGDQLDCSVVPKEGGKGELSLALKLEDVTTERGGASLPVVRSLSLRTRLTFEAERETVIVQGSGSVSPNDRYLQVVIVRVVRLPIKGR